MFKIQFLHIAKNGGTSIKATKNPHILFREHEYTSAEGPLDDFIVLRDPITRFISAFYMRFSDPASRKQTKEWAKQTGIITPDMFIDWKLGNPTKENIIENNIGYAEHKLKNVDNKGKNYFMVPQSSWHNNPSNVLLFENLDKEYQELLKVYDIPMQYLKRHNRGDGSRDFSFTREQLAWLRSEYHNDFVLWEHYSSQNISSRLRRDK